MRSLPILTFHSIGGGRSVLQFPEQVLKRGLERLCREGWQTVDLLPAVERLRQGSVLPPKAFVITFDDGYASVYRRAFPVLRSLGQAATVFVTVGADGAAKGSARLPRLEGREMLSWSELAEMLEAGFSVGAHTVTHPDLTRLSPDRVRWEMTDSRDRLQDRLGVAVRAFAYPYGRHNAEAREQASALFEIACSDRLGWASPNSDPYALERIETYYLRHHQLFELLATPWIRGYLALRSGPRRLRRGAQELLRRRRDRRATA